MSNKKYYINNEGRIVALKNFSNIKAGDIGGFIEFEHNLSHDGDCWVFANARVFENAKVFENARVFGDAEISVNSGLRHSIFTAKGFSETTEE